MPDKQQLISQVEKVLECNELVGEIAKDERPDRTFYLIEVEKAGQQDRNLFYAEDGTLLKDEADTRNDEVLPNISFN